MSQQTITKSLETNEKYQQKGRNHKNKNRWKNTVSEINNSPDGVNIRLEMAEDKNQLN